MVAGLVCHYVCLSVHQITSKNNERIYISVLLEVCSVQCSIPMMIRINIQIQNPDLTDFHARKFAVSDWRCLVYHVFVFILPVRENILVY